MASANLLCIECGYIHEAQEWHVKQSDDGLLAYVCTEGLDTILDRSQWKPLKASSRRPLTKI